ncbi:hypothetical protein UCRNP2_9002 [Neofusicoccum parvum UCRNP2]|uniref:DUF7918 domain-containing protein n=1 Tax=Botryosphaeria parva (strain UCR-NP2) TaxID=1287680 RepID=R1FYN7_BOTPV|nr:hypothetical protein UCRNP2_9002 [Neofusicoccum parvum UCRNP2]
MAVIKQLRGLHVTIACQKEYADVDEEQAKGTVTKYIEAVSGKSFKINWRFESNFQYKEYDITSWIYLDGKKVDSLFIDSERLGPSGYVTSLGAARNEDNRDIHKKGLAESVQSLGEISVRLWREQLAAAGDVKKEGNVKRERPSNDDGDVEGRRKRRRSATLLPAEILDLTSDD